VLAVIAALNRLQNFFINIVSVGCGQVKSREGLRVSIRVSIRVRLVIRHKFHQRYAYCFHCSRLAAS